MPIITFEGKKYECDLEETLLDGLTRQGVMLPSSCRSGSCQTCLMRAVKGTPPEASQQGLKDTLKVQGYFMACICKLEGDLEVSLTSVSKKHTAVVQSKTWMNESIVRLRLSCEGFDYLPGQFINLVRPTDGLARSYSLASVPGDGVLELHVKKIPGGTMSTWICDSLETGEDIDFFGPAGDCFYVPGKPDQNLILAGTGTGLAPLYGIIRHAFSLGHSGHIFLFHGSLATAGLYMVDELRTLIDQHSNVSSSRQVQYIPCVLHGDPPQGGMSGSIDDLIVQVAREHIPKSKAFLCGDPPMVEAMRKKCFLAGVSSQDIYADAFTFVPNGSDTE